MDIPIYLLSLTNKPHSVLPVLPALVFRDQNQQLVLPPAVTQKIDAFVDSGHCEGVIHVTATWDNETQKMKLMQSISHAFTYDKALLVIFCLDCESMQQIMQMLHQKYSISLFQ